MATRYTANYKKAKQVNTGCTEDSTSLCSLPLREFSHINHFFSTPNKTHITYSLLTFLYQISATFLISNFRHVLNVECFLLGNSPASEFYMPTFRNTLFHLHRQVGVKNDKVENLFYFYRCTVHLEDSLIITPTNVLVLLLLL